MEAFAKSGKNCHSEQREASQFIECTLFIDSSPPPAVQNNKISNFV